MIRSPTKASSARPHLGPRASGWPQINFFITLKVLPILFQGWCILCKNAEFQNFWSPLYLLQFGALIFSGWNPKLKNLALACCWACCKVSKMVCHNPISPKLNKEDRILGNGLLPDQGQSYKASTMVIYDSTVLPDLKIPHITTLES